MKKLQLEFQSNVDQCGLHTFKQIKRSKNTAIYERIRKDGTVHSYETFKIKVVKAGSPLPNGSVVMEDYEAYPGKSSFGRTAYSCKSLERAEQRYDELETIANENTEDIDDDAVSSPSDVDKTKRMGQNEAGRGKRGRKAKQIKMPIPRKGEKFTIKNLMAWSGESQPMLYIRLKPLLASGMVSVAGEVRQANTRGKAQILYISNTDSFAEEILVEAS